ncbi:lytic polysaccharide monooxygenase [Actinoplanes sp. KI2]|uniref:lytic polysaccharide monooxygenase n=1 Tax=Actinoplanes sp. KI2 TaxID=2983315 RepID=UPI0021D58F8A|nr:lytic polysaccharide monooxygenase [Actinoplanes sp. KI2]MCU7728094.1 lytic polysaccharide monooxygenase [Actinoplanes sp. KI2]
MIRRLAAAAAAGLLPPLLLAVPTFAHGAPTTPISRSAACAAGGGTATGTAACKAARAANGGPFGTFDNLRVPNVNGDDRKFVPDGKLCSGGLAAFKGLDLARDDFPSTTVSAGKTLPIKYRATLPHEGSFRIYLTKQGFDPSKKLTWGDLGGKLAEIKDPPLSNGSYQMSVKLPSDRTGRHILYIVWQTSSTADTYYSCSDLVFKPATAAGAAPVATKKAAASKSPAARATTAAAPAASPEQADTTPAAAEQTQQAITPVGDQSKVTLGHGLVAGALLVAAGFLAYALIGGFLRRRRENR